MDRYPDKRASGFRMIPVNTGKELDKYYCVIWGIISRFTDKFFTEWVKKPRLITFTSSAAYRAREPSSIPPEISIIIRSLRPSLFSTLMVRVI
jgi:hypothetical protein